MYVLASGALSAAPFGARPCIWTNASSNWVICAVDVDVMPHQRVAAVEPGSTIASPPAMSEPPQ